MSEWRDDCPSCGALYPILSVNSSTNIYGFAIEMSHLTCVCPYCGHIYAIFVKDVEELIEGSVALGLELHRMSVPSEVVIEMYREGVKPKLKAHKLSEKQEHQLFAWADMLKQDDLIRKEIDEWK